MTRLPAVLLLSALTGTLIAQTNETPTQTADYRARYGHAEMNISCREQARSPFERGLLQLHSFAWEQARASFEETIKADPDCAMAWWGVAMTYYDGLHEHPSAEDVDKARAALANGWKVRTRTEREAGYLAAADEIFNGYPDVERVVRDLVLAHIDQIAGMVDRIREVVPMTDLWQALIKAPVFGLIISMAGCFQGMLVEGNAEDVGRRTTAAVVQAIFLVIVLDAFFAVFFTAIGWL